MPLVRKNFVPVDVRPIPSNRSIDFLEEGGDVGNRISWENPTTLGDEGLIFSDDLGGETFEFNTSDASRIASFVAFNGGTSAELVSFFFSNTGVRAVGDIGYLSFRLLASGLGDVPQEFARFGVEATEMETPGTDSGAATISALDADTMTEFVKIDPLADLIQLDLPLDVKNRGGDLGSITSSGVITSNRPPGGDIFEPLTAIFSSEGGIAFQKLVGGIFGKIRLIGEPNDTVPRSLQILGPSLGSILLTSTTHSPSPNQLSVTGFKNVLFGGLGGIPQNIQLGTGTGGDEVSIIENLTIGSAVSDPSVILKVIKSAVPRAIQDPIMTEKERDAITTLGLANDPTTPPDPPTPGTITTVIDKDLTAPPGGESVGDRYIVGISATGDWASQDNDVAVVDSITPTVWSFVTVSEGDLLIVTDESKRYRFLNGAWKETDQEALRVYCDVDNSTDLNAVKQWFGFNGSAWVILG